MWTGHVFFSILQPRGALFFIIADISGREFTNYMAGVSYESLCKTRLKVLATTPEDIRNLAQKVKKIIDRNNICVVGSKSAIEGSKELFKEIKELR